jgi:hypothetical protein
VTTEVVLSRVEGDNTPQIQQAIDSLSSQGGTVYLQGHPLPWMLSNPVINDRSGVKLKGQDSLLSRLWASSNYSPVISGFGLLRQASLDHWQASGQLLDGTAGSRFAFRTYADGEPARPSFSGSPFSEGPHPGWSTVRKLSFSFAFVLHALPADGQINFFGCQDIIHRPGPYLFATALNLYSFLDLRTPDNERLRIRLIWTPSAADVGQLTKIDGEINLDTGTHAMWVNGTRRTTTMDGASLAGKTLYQPDQGLPFGIAAVCSETHAWGQSFGTGGADLSIVGFKLTTDAVFDSTVNTPARLDGLPNTDLRRYFTAEPKTIGYLPLNEVRDDRLIRWRSASLHELGLGDVHGYGQAVDPRRGGGGEFTGKTTFEDLELSCNQPYGAALLSAGTPSANTFYKRVSFVGGAYAFHGANYYRSYTASFEDCSITGGWIAGWRAYCLLCTMRGVHFHSGHRHSICHTGCTINKYGGSMDGNFRRISSVRQTEGQYGLGFTWKDGGYLDFEEPGPNGEPPYPSLALFDMQAQSWVAGTLFILDGIGMPRVPPGRTIAVLRPSEANSDIPFPARMSVRDCGFIGNLFNPPQNGLAMARVTGGQWSVEASGDPQMCRPQGVPLAIDAEGNEIEE